MAAEVVEPVVPEVGVAEEAMTRAKRASSLEAAALAEAQEAQRSSPVTQPKMDALPTTRHLAISESSS